MVRIKRIYEPAAKEDGERFLVERLWARGIKKTEARLAGWLKGIAPSAELRQWYAHNIARWPEFQKRYQTELRDPARKELLDDLVRRARRGTITLVYAAKDTEHNSALVLRRVIERRLRS